MKEIDVIGLFSEYYEGYLGPCDNVFDDVENEFPYHIDIELHRSLEEDSLVSLATVGMSSIPMNIEDSLNRCELIMMVHPSILETSDKFLIAVDEIHYHSKYPRESNSWYGQSHSIGVSKDFKEEFGYDCILLNELIEPFNYSDNNINTPIHFLFMVPLYFTELEMINNIQEEYEYDIRNGFVYYLLDNLKEESLAIGNRRDEVSKDKFISYLKNNNYK